MRRPSAHRRRLWIWRTQVERGTVGGAFSPMGDQAVLGVCAGEVLGAMKNKVGAWIIDDTGNPKKGEMRSLFAALRIRAAHHDCCAAITIAPVLP